MAFERILFTFSSAIDSVTRYWISCCLAIIPLCAKRWQLGHSKIILFHSSVPPSATGIMWCNSHPFDLKTGDFADHPHIAHLPSCAASFLSRIGFSLFVLSDIILWFEKARRWQYSEQKTEFERLFSGIFLPQYLQDFIWHLSRKELGITLLLQAYPSPKHFGKHRGADFISELVLPIHIPGKAARAFFALAQNSVAFKR